jgi:hypothetical protein
MTSTSGDAPRGVAPQRAPRRLGRVLSSWQTWVFAGLLAVLAVGGLFVLKGPHDSSPPPKKEAMCYVLQSRGKWYRQDTNQEVKPGEELFAGDVLRPEKADADHVLTVYLYGKGSHEVPGQTGPYIVPPSTVDAPDVIDRLVALLPHVNRMFPEATISRGDSDEPPGSLLLLTDHGLDVSSLMQGDSNENGKRRVRLRFIPVPTGSSAAEDPLQKSSPTGATARPSAALESPLPAASSAALSPPAKPLEFPYTWNPGSPQLVSPVAGLQPGLYRLQLWSGPARKSPAPVDAEAFPDREFLVLVLTRGRDFDSARAEDQSFQKGAKTNWNRSMPPELRSEFQRAFLLSLAARYLPMQEPVR